MSRRKRRDPSRQEKSQLRHRELIHQLCQDADDLLHAHAQAVDAHNADAEARLQRRAELLRALAVRLLGIDEHDKRLSGGLHVGDGALLGVDIILARDVGDGAVSRHDDADGAVILHDLLCAKLRGLRHGDLCFKPRRRHHARRAVLVRADGARDHIADRVDQPDRETALSVRADLDGLLGYEFRLRRHNGLAGAALRQLILGAFTPIDVFYVGQDELLHKPLDKR